jgi:predicted nucleotidyltransferase component of viral defense system
VITRSELASVADLKRLSLRNAERDYLLELILYSTSDFRRSLVLKGGAALYNFYNLNRFSEDLGFDIVGRRPDLGALVGRILGNLERIGMPRTAWEKEEHRNEINIRFTVRGPLYDGSRGSMSRVTLNFSKRERPTSVHDMLLVASYPEIPSFELSVLGIEEIAAEKIRGIMTREKPRDVYDLWFMVKRGTKVDISVVDKKLKIYGLKFHPRTFCEKMYAKRNMWTRDLKGLIIGTLPEFDDVAAELESKCKEWA